MPYQFKTYEEQLGEARTRSYGNPGSTATAAPPAPTASLTPVRQESTTAAAPARAPVAPPAPRPQPANTGPPRGSAAPAPVIPPPAGAPLPAKPSIQIKPWQAPPPGPSENVFQSIRTGMSKIPSALQGTANAFTEAAGPYRTWEGVGGQQTIQGILQAPAKETPDLTPAKALLGAQYTGPNTLDQNTIAGLQNDVTDLQARAGGMETVGGIEDALAGVTVGMSPGELAFEAQRMQENPAFREQVLGARQEVARLQSEISRADQEAQAIAATRAEQEANIASQAKTYLTGEQSAVDTALAQRIMEEEARNAQVAGGYEEFKQTGSLVDLAHLPAGALKGWTPEDFTTPATMKLDEAKFIRGAIMAKYPGIADVPLLTLQATSKGKETIGFPQDWYTQAKKTKSKAEIETIRKQAMARQKELEKAGFASKAYGFTGVLPAKNVPGVNPKVEWKGGKYGLLSPLYFGQKDWKPADPRGYTSFDIGVSPSRENISTEEQRAVFNRVSEIMDQAARLEAAGEPYQAAKIKADVQKYLADEAATLEKRKGNLSEAQTDWAHQVATLRKNYRDSQREDLLGSIGMAAGGLLGLLTGPFAPIAVPSLIGIGNSAGKKMA